MKHFLKKLLSLCLIVGILLPGFAPASAAVGKEGKTLATETSLVDWEALLNQRQSALTLPKEGTYAPNRLLVTRIDSGIRNAAISHSSIIDTSTLFSLPMPQEAQEVAAMADGEEAVVTCTTISLSEGSDMLAVIEDISQQEGVLAVEFDKLYTVSSEDKESTVTLPFAPAKDPLVAQQTWLDFVGATKAWDMFTAKGTVPGKDVVVAVLDSGIDTEHPDLKDQIVPGGKQFIAASDTAEVVISDNIDDKIGHGTHVSGIIAGAKNGTGITGVAYGAKILPIKVTDDEGAGYESNITAGMLYAAGMDFDEKSSYSLGEPRCNIANMSLGYNEGQPALAFELAISIMRSQGIFVVVAAGNEATSTSYVHPANIYSQYTAPAYITGAFTVMAMQETPDENGDNLTYFSNWDSDPYEGAEYTLMAPGENILSSVVQEDGAYEQYSGTSMASPVVAGAAALVLSANPEYSDDDLWSVLATTGKKLQGKTDEVGDKYSYHTLDVAAAMKTDPDTVKSVVKGNAEGYWTEDPGINIAPLLVLPMDGSLPQVKLNLRGFDNIAYNINATSTDLKGEKTIGSLAPGGEDEIIFTLKEMPDIKDGFFQTDIDITWLNRDGSKGSETVEVWLAIQKAVSGEKIANPPSTIAEGYSTIFVIDKPTTIAVNIPKSSTSEGEGEFEKTATCWSGLYYFTENGSLTVTGETEVVMWGGYMLDPQISGNVSLLGTTIEGTKIRESSIMNVKQILGSNIHSYPGLNIEAERIAESTIANCAGGKVTAGSVVSSTFAENYNAVMDVPVEEPFEIIVTELASAGSGEENPAKGFYGNAVQGPTKVMGSDGNPAKVLECYYLPTAEEWDNEAGLYVLSEINKLSCAEGSTVYTEGDSDTRPAMLEKCPAFVISTKRVEDVGAVVDKMSMSYNLETEFSRDMRKVDTTDPETSELETALTYKATLPPFGNSVAEDVKWADDGRSCTYWVYTGAASAQYDDFYALDNLPVPVQFDLRNPTHNRKTQFAELTLNAERVSDGFEISWEYPTDFVADAPFIGGTLTWGIEGQILAEHTITEGEMDVKTVTISRDKIAPGDMYDFDVVLWSDETDEPATKAMGVAVHYEPYNPVGEAISLRDSAGKELTELRLSGRDTATVTLLAERSFNMKDGMKVITLLDGDAFELTSVVSSRDLACGVAQDGDKVVAEIAPSLMSQFGTRDCVIAEGETIATLTFKAKNVSMKDGTALITINYFDDKPLLGIAGEDGERYGISFVINTNTSAVSSGDGDDSTSTGSDTTTKTLPDGTVVTTTKNADGSIQIVYTAPNGVRSTVKTPANGESSTANITIPSNLSGKSVRVNIPMPDGSATTVAVLVGADGKQQVLTTSIWKDGVLTVPLTGNANIIIRDNAKTFTDIKLNDWFAGDVAFVTSRELFKGVGENSFAPHLTTSRAMLFVALQRLAGETTTPKDGESWYDSAMIWAKEKGISDGTAPMENITRQQLAVMLYRYAGSPATTQSTSAFSDSVEIADWAQTSMAWTVEKGILRGADGKLNPKGQATRAEVSAMLARFVSNT